MGNERKGQTHRSLFTSALVKDIGWLKACSGHSCSAIETRLAFFHLREFQ